MSELEGRVALITGSGRGIGLGIARVLAGNGAIVVLNDLYEDRLLAAERELRRYTSAVLTIRADVSRESDVEALVTSTLRTFGKIDILVNNAGLAVFKATVDHSSADWDAVLGTNVKGAFLCCRSVLPHMMSQHRGSVVNISSVAAFQVTGEHVAYAVSKAAIVALTRELAYEAGPFGVRVNTVAPGPIRTPLSESVMSEEDRSAFTKALRLGRWGSPDDVGEAVNFLVSDRASFITGATLAVTGGSDLAAGVVLTRPRPEI